MTISLYTTAGILKKETNVEPSNKKYKIFIKNDQSFG